MIYFKSCTRCQGDLFTDSDHDGSYTRCLQCGHHRYPQAAIQLAFAAPDRREGGWHGTDRTSPRTYGVRL